MKKTKKKAEGWKCSFDGRQITWFDAPEKVKLGNCRCSFIKEHNTLFIAVYFDNSLGKTKATFERKEENIIITLTEPKETTSLEGSVRTLCLPDRVIFQFPLSKK